MARSRRPSPQTVAILQALADDPRRWRHGYDLCLQLGIKAGSTYPILIRLADRGLLETSWEAEQVAGRPRRHLYRLTDLGHAYALAHTSAAATAPLAPATSRRPRLGWGNT